jgi:putative ABC transport system permease protein
MKLASKLAYSQIKANRNRAFWMLAGIAISTAMITAVCGFASSADAMFKGLMGESDFYNSIYNEMLLGLGAVFGSIIIAVSEIVMSNAFRISAGERVKQFGILKSIGAEKRHISRIIVFEGLFLAVAAVPMGVILGLIVNYTGIQILDNLLAAANRRNTFQVNFDFAVTWQAIIIPIILLSATVWVSAWLPARKAARIAAIDAIRGAGEVRIRAKDMRGGRFIGKLFGFEGMLAYRSIKRSRRNYRATVVSLTVSIMLFVAAGEFGAQYKETAQLYYLGTDANVVSSFICPEQSATVDGKESEQRPHTIASGMADEITKKMLEYPNTTVFGVGDDYNSYSTVIPIEMFTPSAAKYLDSGKYAYCEYGYSLPVTFYTVDSENYAAMCKRLGVPHGSNILINYVRIPGSEGKTIMEPFVFKPGTLRITDLHDHSEFELPLDGLLEIRDVPNEIATIYVGNIAIIVPQLDAIRYFWFASSSDTRGFASHADKVLRESVSFDESKKYISVVQNVEESIYARRDIQRLIMVFIYGFVTMLTLIGLTNVISTISANVHSRAREFAVLRSVGLTPAGLKRMLNLESILCSTKALVFGLPIGIIGSYLRYRSFMPPVELNYAIPWIPILQCTIGVIAITWVTIRCSMSRLRSDNIIETIRSV